MKISEKDKAMDAALARQYSVKHSNETNLTFLNNRTTVPN